MATEHHTGPSLQYENEHTRFALMGDVELQPLCAQVAAKEEVDRVPVIFAGNVDSHKMFELARCSHQAEGATM